MSMVFSSIPGNFVQVCRQCDLPTTVGLTDGICIYCDAAKLNDNGVRCRCCDQGKVKRFHCPACNDLDAR